MCRPNQPKEGQILRKQDFIIPEDWEPTSLSLKQIIELRDKAVSILGPDIVREILEDAGVTPEGDVACESDGRR